MSVALIFRLSRGVCVPSSQAFLRCTCSRVSGSRLWRLRKVPGKGQRVRRESELRKVGRVMAPKGCGRRCTPDRPQSLPNTKKGTAARRDQGQRGPRGVKRSRVRESTMRPEIKLERFQGFLELIGRFEFEFRRRENYIFF